jgi:hypothetical protein
VRRNYLLVETQGPWKGPGCGCFIADADTLARSGEAVWLVLLEDGVTSAVGTRVPELLDLVRNGGRLWIDSFSLAQRSLTAAPLVGGHELVEMDDVARKLLDPDVRAVWH